MSSGRSQPEDKPRRGWFSSLGKRSSQESPEPIELTTTVRGSVGAALDRIGFHAVQLDHTTMGDRGARPALPPEFPDTVGRYEVLGELGRGGAGVVFEALDTELLRKVAVKLLNRPGDRREIARFVAESQITSQLTHPGIVPVHDMGITEDGHFYYVMKRVEGRSLSEIIEGLRQGVPELKRVWTRRKLLSAFAQVCQALAYAHSRGVLHRDLKPSNIMLGSFGEVLVMDWGVARLWTRTPESGEAEPVAPEAGSLLGTPGFMSPEQARGEFDALEPRSDVWSLGAILYVILTWQSAYQGPRTARIVGPLAGPPEDPCSRAPQRQIPRAIADVCLKAMASEPGDRYTDASALGNAVEAFLDGAQREHQAQQLVERARERLSESERLRRSAQDYREEAGQTIAALPENAPEELRWAGWELESEAEELEQYAVTWEVEGLQLAQAALQAAQDFPPALALLANHYRLKHEHAEERGDRQEAAELELLLRTHDRGRHEDYLAGHGWVGLLTTPPAQVALARVVEKNRRLLPEDEVRTLQSPLQELELEMGSYQLTLSAPGHQDVIYPVRVERMGTWLPLRPGDARARPLRLPRQGELRPDEVLVAEGWCAVGGDPSAAGGVARADVWVDGFVMRRAPVTNGEFLFFLNDLLSRGDSALAERCQLVGTRGPVLRREPTGRFALPADWRADAPVTMVSWRAAHECARWLAGRTGQPWRLPHEIEWEKAARGVDGRSFPWGNRIESGWCNHWQDGGQLLPVTSHERDVSPYGIRGLGGNAADWCSDPMGPGYARVQGRRLEAEPYAAELDAQDVRPRLSKGGTWQSLPHSCRSAGRRGLRPDIGYQAVSFRLVRSLG